MWNNFCTIMECMWDLLCLFAEKKWKKIKENKWKKWMCNTVNLDDEIYACEKYEIWNFIILKPLRYEF